MGGCVSSEPLPAPDVQSELSLAQLPQPSHTKRLQQVLQPVEEQQPLAGGLPRQPQRSQQQQSLRHQIQHQARQPLAVSRRSLEQQQLHQQQPASRQTSIISINGSIRQASVTASPGSFSFDVLSQVQHLQQQLALVSSTPALGLMEAAELLSRRLKVSLVSVMAFASEADAPACALAAAGGALAGPSGSPRGAAPTDRPCIMLAAHGRGALVLERNLVMCGEDWSAVQLMKRARAEVAAAGTAARDMPFYHSDLQPGGADGLPSDWRALKQDARLQSFAAVLIGPPDSPLGVLGVAKEERAGLADHDSWKLWLSAAATGLMHSMHQWQVPFTCSMICRSVALEDPIAFISCILQNAKKYMLRAANLHVGVRLAVLDESDRSKAIMFRAEPKSRGTPPSGSGHSASVSASLPSDLADGVVASTLEVAGTLLESAMTMRKARFVRNCASYMQTCLAPAKDMFVAATEPVASVVVVPLVVKEVAFGAIYFSLDTPSDFANLQDTLLGFVASATLLVHHKISGRTQLLRGAVTEATRIQSARLPSVFSPQSQLAGLRAQLQAQSNSQQQLASEGQGAASGQLPAHRHGAQQEAERLMHLLDESCSGTPLSRPESGTHAGGAGGGAGGGGGGGDRGGSGSSPQNGGSSPKSGERGDSSPGAWMFGDGCALSTVSARRLCTEAMMEVVQSEIRRNRSRQASSSSSLTTSYLTDLVLHKVIGTGGYGMVYRGTWKKITAAIKVFYARSTEREAMKDAVEMAVLSTVHHPNIVSVYACLTDMVEVGDTDSMGSGSGASAGPILKPRYRKLSPEEEHEGVVCNIVVMEYCDCGTLWSTIRRGVFHSRMRSGDIGVNLPAVLEVLQEVAESIKYLHGLHLVHCDIKSDNILLKADSSRRLGFMPKLADFGLVKLLKDDYIRNRSGAGTITHLAPEMFAAGSKITTGVDSYAFGVLMFEMYTGQRPYQGFKRDAITALMRAQKHLRPTFPAGTPDDYLELATRCWATEPSDRPNLSEIVETLSQMQERLERSPPGPIGCTTSTPSPASSALSAHLDEASAAAASASGSAAPQGSDFGGTPTGRRSGGGATPPRRRSGGAGVRRSRSSKEGERRRGSGADLGDDLRQLSG